MTSFSNCFARLLAPVALIAGVAGCYIEEGSEGDFDRCDSDKLLIFEADATSADRVEVTGVNGLVIVDGEAGIDTVHVEAVASVSARSFAEAEAELERLTVEVVDSGGSIEIRTVQPDPEDDYIDYRVDYEITMPAHLGLDIVNVNGDVVAKGLQSSAAVSLVNGFIGIGTELPPAGQVDLRLVNGDIVLAVPPDTSATLHAELTNGETLVEDLRLDDQVTTGSSVAGVLGSGDGAIQLETVNGDIVITSSR